MIMIIEIAAWCYRTIYIHLDLNSRSPPCQKLQEIIHANDIALKQEEISITAGLADKVRFLLFNLLLFTYFIRRFLSDLDNGNGKW